MCAGSSRFVGGGGIMGDVEQVSEVGQASVGALGGELALGRDEVSMAVMRSHVR